MNKRCALSPYETVWDVLLVSTQECHRCERDRYIKIGETHEESDAVGEAGLPRQEWGGGQGGENVGDVFGAYGRCGLVKARCL
jgi:hypothetical protein